MRVSGDASAVYRAIDQVRSLLKKLNTDGSFDGFAVRFESMLVDLPNDFIVGEFMPAIDAEDLGYVATVIVKPGPRLNAYTAALQALDVDQHSPPPPCAYGGFLDCQ